MPCKPTLFKHKEKSNIPVFGLFDDSLPDGWGLLLMDRFFEKQNIELAKVSVLDRLIFIGLDTIGALTYHPPSLERKENQQEIDLHLLAEEAKDVYEGKVEDVLPNLLRMGGSPQGARPKVLVGYNPKTGVVVSGEDDLPDHFEHWIVKFSARKDSKDAGPVEYAYSQMASNAGIEIEETKLFETSEGDRFFGMKRFDRSTGNVRYHIHTLANLIHADFRTPCCDYSALLKAISFLTRDYKQLEKVYRLMCFNVLAHNRDDHVKNFSCLLDDENGKWHFAPAYDLTFSYGHGLEHTTSIAGEGKNPTEKHCLQVADKAGISSKVGMDIFREVQDAVSCWPDIADQVGVGGKACKKIESTLEKI
jgi:serine/threonine-protein kinase HipA